MAVTAPTYVLEESLSSQKLWKQTAGNRPPQPVEERAYFEQMWAQNFARSSVKYEIPVEVLTASTPISISPFNDERFMDDENISNYNLAGTFHNVEDTTGGGKGGGGDHDADCIAEAALNQRRQQHQQQRFSGNGAVHMYFDPNRPKEYNLKTLGPHHHHHTLVNKKVNNVNGENTMTVLVRGDNVFGTTVSKSFQRVNEHGEQTNGIDTVSISIASYRVVEVRTFICCPTPILFFHYIFLCYHFAIPYHIPLHLSRRNTASMHSTLLSSAMATFVIPSEYGSDTRTFLNLVVR
jgi:hypothetical protein